MAQVNEIDNRINNQRLKELERRQQQPLDNSNAELWEYIQTLEHRIEQLESLIKKSNEI